MEFEYNVVFKGLLQAMGMGMLHLQAFHPCVHHINPVGTKDMAVSLSRMATEAIRPP
jgi:hypothetical protein